MSKMSEMAQTIEELRKSAAAINDAADWLAEQFSGDEPAPEPIRRPVALPIRVSAQGREHAVDPRDAEDRQHGRNDPAQERQRLDDGVPAEARGVAHRAEVLDEASADSA